MSEGLTTSEEQKLQEKRGKLIEESVKQQEEVTGQTSKFAQALATAKDDLTNKIGETATGIKKTTIKNIKSFSDSIISGLGPEFSSILKGIASTGKGLFKGGQYVKSLFTGERQREIEKEKEKKKKKVKDEPKKKKETDQSEELIKIRDNTLGIKEEVVNLASIMRGDRLDDLEKRREESRQDDQMLEALQDIGKSSDGLAIGTNEDQPESNGFFDKIKEKLLSALKSFGASVASFLGLKRLLGRGARANAGTAAASGRNVSKTSGATKAAGAVTGARTSVAAGAGTAAAAGAGAASAAGAGTSVAGGAGQSASSVTKYPKLLKFAKFIRGVPGLSALAAGVEGIMIASDDEMPLEEKKKELSRVIGSALGGVAGTKLGAILGTLAFPGLGSIAGALSGGVGGYFFGGKIARNIANVLLDSPETEGSDVSPSGGTSGASSRSTARRAGRVGSNVRSRTSTSNARVSGAASGRSRRLDRVQSDRTEAANAAARRTDARRSDSTNISTNIQNSSTGIIRQRPSASSEPDNASDAVIYNW